MEREDEDRSDHDMDHDDKMHGKDDMMHHDNPFDNVLKPATDKAAGVNLTSPLKEFFFFFYLIKKTYELNQKKSVFGV